MLHLPESESRIALHGVESKAFAGIEDQGTFLLPTGHNDHRYPLDIDNNPRVSGGNQSTSLNPTLQVSTTNNTDVIVKKGVRQWVSLLNRDAAPQNYHQNSNEGNGESSGLAKGQRVFGVEASDVVLAEDSFDTCGNFKNKEVEGPVSEEAACITHQDQDISNYTPKDKSSKLGLNPQAGGENTWQVYSRQRKCQKKSDLGLSPSNTAAAPYNGDTQPQHTDFDTARGNTQ